jgi:hypothetical protein
MKIFIKPEKQPGTNTLEYLGSTLAMEKRVSKHCNL